MDSIGGHSRSGARGCVAASTLLALATLAAAAPMWSPGEGIRGPRDGATVRVAAAMAVALDLLSADATSSKLCPTAPLMTVPVAASDAPAPNDIDRPVIGAPLDLRHLDLPPPARF